MSKKKRGRPTVYTDAIADEICRRLAEGESLRAICEDPKLPAESTVRGWAVDDHEGFFRAYDRARCIQADAYADRIVEDADDDSGDVLLGSKGGRLPNNAAVARSKLKVDTRKWLMERYLPRRFGSKTQVANLNVDLATMSDDQLARIAAGEDPVAVATGGA